MSLAETRREAGKSSSAALWLTGLGFLIVLCAGGYFWRQWDAAYRPMTMTTPPARVMPVSASVPFLTLIPTLRAEENAVRPKAARPAPPAPPKKALLPPASPPETPARTTAEPREPTEPAFRLTRSAPQTNTTLERAYEALQSGRDEDARRDYEKVLRADGKNTDAWLGLATLAARQGQIEKAHEYYLRALEADPLDPTARAGVLSLGEPRGDAESLLKTALARQPGSPALALALGNLYARQQRWSEAQPMYFQAYDGEPDNPDIIFNLAVSLDHLRQNELAARYYRMALDAGKVRASAFRRNQAEARLLELPPR